MRNKLLFPAFFVPWLQLGKITIAIPVSLTAFLGYFMVRPVIDAGALWTVSGVLMLAMASSAVNQIQERTIDRLMKRTRKRPIPAGAITVPQAAVVATLAAAGGLLLILQTGSWLAVAVGAFTMAWYNLVYTPLKRVTSFAVFPGAVIGALPPMIGWSAAGGSLLHPDIVLVSFFLFIGQMPHYWLLMMKVGDEYQEAGLPVITAIFSPRQLRNISFTWIVAAAVTVLMFPVAEIIRTNWVGYLLVGLILLFLLRMFLLSFRGELMKNWKKAFVTVNLFYLLIILLLIADTIIESYLYTRFIP